MGTAFNNYRNVLEVIFEVSLKAESIILARLNNLIRVYDGYRDNGWDNIELPIYNQVNSIHKGIKYSINLSLWNNLAFDVRTKLELNGKDIEVMISYDPIDKDFTGLYDHKNLDKHMVRLINDIRNTYLRSFLTNDYLLELYEECLSKYIEGLRSFNSDYCTLDIIETEDDFSISLDFNFGFENNPISIFLPLSGELNPEIDRSIYDNLIMFNRLYLCLTKRESND